MKLDLTLLPASVRGDGELTEAEVWQNIQAEVQADPELWGAITQALRADPEPSDSYPTAAFPDASWFEPQVVPTGLKVTVMPGGRIMGRFWNHGECVIGQSSPGNCWTPKPSPTGYEGFHQSDTPVAGPGGVELLQTGLLVPGHAHPSNGVTAAMQHYNNPEHAKAAVRCYDDEHGGYFVGSLLHGVTYGDVATVLASATSGHWTWRENMALTGGGRGNGYDCLGPCLVARPALPLERPGVKARFRQPVLAAASGEMIEHPDMILETWTMDTEDKTEGSCSCEKPGDVMAALTFDARRERLRDSLRSRFLPVDDEGRSVGYLYVRDFTESTVYFEIEDLPNAPQGLLGLEYSVTNDAVSASGEPFSAVVAFRRAGESDSDVTTGNQSVTTADEAPVDVAASVGDTKEITLAEVLGEVRALGANLEALSTTVGGIEGYIAETESAKITVEDLEAARADLEGKETKEDPKE